MSTRPHDPSPYEILGVDASAHPDVVRLAYLRLARKYHPDTGGTAAQFHQVQRAWECIGEPAARERYDRDHARDFAPPSSAVWESAPSRGRADSVSSRVSQSRSYGHPGGRSRDHYVTAATQWIGRGGAGPDPYDPAVVRAVPVPIRLLLTHALAEEETARLVAGLGLGFTVWNSVAPAQKIDAVLDHVVLGPAGLFALASADWGCVLKRVRGELTGEGVPPGVQPLRELARSARIFSRNVGVRFSTLAVVVPDDSLSASIDSPSRATTSRVHVVRRSLLASLLRDGAATIPRESVERSFDIRTRINDATSLV